MAGERRGRMAQGDGCGYRANSLGTYWYMSESEVSPFPLYPIRAGRLVRDAGFRLTRPPANNYLVEYVLEGQLNIASQQGEFDIGKGMLGFVDCHYRHRLTSDVGCTHLYLYLGGVAAGAYCDYIRDHAGGVLSVSASHPIVAKMLFLFSSLRDGEAIAAPVMCHHVDDLLSQMALRAMTDLKGRISAVMDAKRYIAEHFSEPITLDELSDRACVSKYHFAKLFKEETGVSPHRYLINVRIDHAKEMLCFTESSILDVARSCGFDDRSTFSAAFKRETGISPTSFREEATA